MTSHIAIDFETYYSKRLRYSMKTMIAEQYCNSHHFDCYMMSATDGVNTWSGHPKDFNWESLDGAVIVSHNKYFDLSVWIRLHQLGICPPPNYKEFHCTANLTAYLCNRRSLDMAVEHLYNIRLDKTDRADAVEKHWPQDFSPAQQESMLRYAKSDVIWCHKLWADFSTRWPDWERRLSNQTIDQGMRGVQIDTVLLDQYLIQTHEMRRSAELQIPWIIDAEDEEWEDFNDKPTSTKCIAEMCRKSGIPACPVKSDDEDAYIEWENTYSKAHPWILAVTAWRSINKLYKTFVKAKERLRPDGTMPFALKYFGAHTGRWSGAEGINFQNFRRKPVLCTQEGLLELNEKKIDLAMDDKKKTGEWPAWVKYSVDFRHLIIPRPGTKLLVCDLSQIEPRVLAWLAGNWKLLNLLKANPKSLYEAFARAKMGWTGGILKDENPTMYSLAKAQILALGYQAGWQKFVDMSWDLARVDICKDDPEFVTEIHPITHVETQVSGYGTTSKKVVAEFRAQNTETVALWAKLDNGFKSSVSSNFEIQLPSGRSLRYDKVRCETRIEKDKKTGLPKRKSVFTADSDGRRKINYGGKLTENITQATARDVFGVHLLSLEDAGFTVLFSSHDEAILECGLDRTVKEVETLMSVCPDWLKGCIIGAEGKETPHYCK